MKLSAVATLYHSSKYIQEFYRRMSIAAKQFAGDDYEIILVNDGSPDNSRELAIELTEQDKHVLLVDLSKNFGHHKAMMTGLAQAQGELVFLIDSDLEEEPELLASFSRQMLKTKCDVVFGVQEKRKGGWFERWSGTIFYWMFNFLADIKVPRNIVTARLMSRRFVKALLLHSERELSIGGLYYITGFDQQAQVIKKHSTGSTTYTLSRKISIFINSITSFSNKPLVGIFYLGLSIFFFAAIYSAYLMIRWLFWSTPIVGWTSVMASFWILGGLVISMIGIIGIYLSKVFIETKNRPYTIIRQVFGSGLSENAPTIPTEKSQDEITFSVPTQTPSNPIVSTWRNHND